MDRHTRDYKFESYLELLAFEGFLRRASKQEEKFILKGSLLTRQCIAQSRYRMARDLDFLYGDPINSTGDAERIFSNWAIKVTESYEEDGIRFRSFRENQFWRYIDYAMDDDFPTTNTDLRCWVDEEEMPELGLDISWNLPMVEEAVPLLYQPISGEAFEIPYTVPLPTQISWKLHQCIVRPRIKDMIDIILLLDGKNLEEIEQDKVLECLQAECKKDGIDTQRICAFSEGKLRAYIKKNSFKLEQMKERFYWQSIDTTFGFDLGPLLQNDYLEDTFYFSPPYKDILEILVDFEAALKQFRLGERLKS